jgi:YfiH family protein
VSNADLLYELGRARVLFTDRTHGNLSSVSGEHAERGEEARERLREAQGLEGFARGYQVHGAHVRWVEATCAAPGVSRRGEDDADGQATALYSVGALVLTADCMPVALVGEDCVAALHAGWRGLAAGVLEEGVRVLRARGGAREITAVIGPAAGACCYEVGAEVHEALASSSGRGPLDLRAIARRRLHVAGVADVRDVEVCTICDERFFSHRREGARAGRQAGAVWLS